MLKARLLAIIVTYIIIRYIDHPRDRDSMPPLSLGLQERSVGTQEAGVRSVMVPALTVWLGRVMNRRGGGS